MKVDCSFRHPHCYEDRDSGPSHSPPLRVECLGAVGPTIGQTRRNGDLAAAMLAANASLKGG